MANDIDKTSPHYKGDFGSIYEVNKKFPTGGVAGDFVVIEGWAHYWNADRASWCVNAERDSYWDELITNFIEKFKLIRGGTYMGVASLDTVPAKVIGAKMYYFATVAGTYKNFGDLVVPQGINVFYSENGRSWVNTTLLEVVQELGVSTNKVVSQKALNEALAKKADKETVNTELGKKADKDELDKKADKETVNTELDKKADKTSVASSLDLKANKTDVAKENAKQDAEINRKANQRDVESALNILRKDIGERTVIEGNVENNPDEEDLTSKSTSNGTMVLSLKDRDYNPLEYSGKGYKILRKNLHDVTCAITKIQVTKVPATDGYVSIIINGVETHVNLVASTDNTVALVAKKIADKLYETLDEYVTSVDGALITCTRRFGGDVTTSSFSGVNTGSEATVSESSKTELRNLLTPVMINQPNTIYEIRYDFDLNGNEIAIQEGCIFEFNGGTLRNGTLKGKLENKYLCPENFNGGNGNINDDTMSFMIISKICNKLSLKSKRKYYINKRIIFENGFNEIIGNNAIIETTDGAIEGHNIFQSTEELDSFCIRDLTINYNSLESEKYEWDHFGITLHNKHNVIIENVTFNSVLTSNPFTCICIINNKYAQINNCKLSSFTTNRVGGTIWFSNHIHDKSSYYINDCTFEHCGGDEILAFASTGNCNFFITNTKFHLSFPESILTKSAFCFAVNDNINDKNPPIDECNCILSNCIFNIDECSFLHGRLMSTHIFNKDSKVRISLLKCTINNSNSTIDAISKHLIESNLIDDITPDDINIDINIEDSIINDKSATVFKEDNGWYNLNIRNTKIECDKLFTYNSNNRFVGNIDISNNVLILKNNEDAVFGGKYGIEGGFSFRDNVIESENKIISIARRESWGFDHTTLKNNIAKNNIINGIKHIDSTFKNGIGFMYDNVANSYETLVDTSIANNKVSIYLPEGIKILVNNQEMEMQHFEGYDFTAFTFKDIVVPIFLNILDLEENLIQVRLDKSDNYNISGESNNRPQLSEVTFKSVGATYLDTSLNKLIYWNGAEWIDCDGNPADAKKQGISTERPSNVKIGFIYKDTTLNKLIVWNGSSWVNMDGTALA